MYQLFKISASDYIEVGHGGIGMKKLFTRMKEEEAGQALILVALMMVVLLGMGSLVVDYGYMAMQKSELQTAADSAALAGAKSLHEKTIGELEILTEQVASMNIDGDFNIITNSDKANGTVTVQVSQVAPKFFAGVLTSADSTTTIRAEAGAKNDSVWNGEVIPFINIHEPFPVNASISLWEKADAGYFDRINGIKEGIHKEEGPYYKINYSDGVETDNGVVATIKQEVDSIPTNTIVYFFSLKQSVIDTYAKANGNQYKFVGTEVDYLNATKPNVLAKHLSLVRAKLVTNEFKHLVLTVEEIYESDMTLPNLFPVVGSKVYLFK